MVKEEDLIRRRARVLNWVNCQDDDSDVLKIIDKLYKANQNKVTVPKYMLDFIDVMLIGAGKYKSDNWLQPDGTGTSHDKMHNSMFHHLADSYCHIRQDHETGLDPLLHLVARALMVYTRRRLGIKEQ